MAERVRLDSWKEIAAYLGRDVRTVIRWEQQRGLPVYRVPGGRLSRVFAYPHELDAWLAVGAAAPAAGDVPPVDVIPADVAPADATSGAAVEAPTATRRWPATATITGVVITLGALALGWQLSGETPSPQRISMTGSALVAVDVTGRALWTHSFKPNEARPASTRWSEIAALDGDRRESVLAFVNVTRPPLTQFDGELFRFSDGGRVDWSFTADDRVTFRQGEFGPPWPADSDFATYRAGGATHIAVPVHHFTWWPGLLITLNARGQREHTFVNSGWIRSVRGSRDGRHLYIAGVTNQSEAYFFGVLDAASPSGRSPETPGSPFECLSCPAGDPVRYFVFPRTDIGLVQPFPQNGPAIETFEDGTVQIQPISSEGPNVAATIYDFARGFDQVHASFSNSFWEWHRRLEADGRLRHRAEDCPERRGLEIKSWTRAGGWQTINVVPR